MTPRAFPVPIIAFTPESKLIFFEKTKKQEKEERKRRLLLVTLAVSCRRGREGLKPPSPPFSELCLIGGSECEDAGALLRRFEWLAVIEGVSGGLSSVCVATNKDKPQKIGFSLHVTLLVIRVKMGRAASAPPSPLLSQEFV